MIVFEITEQDSFKPEQTKSKKDLKMSDMDAESSADEGQMNTETEEEVDSQGEEEEAADEEQVELKIMRVF